MNRDNCLGVMIDCSRNAVMNIKALKKFIVNLGKMGYNSLMLYTEDTYEVDNQPYFGHLRGRYSKDEIREIDSFAKQHNIELMPCIQTLAHLDGIIRWDNYKAISDIDNIVCIGEEKVYELIDNMFSTIKSCFSSNIVHIGMDEADNMGLGRYLRKNGYRNRIDIFFEHLNRISEIAEKYGLQLLIWHDMFFHFANNSEYCKDGKIDPSIKEKIPKNVTLVYWNYYFNEQPPYDENISLIKSVQDTAWFAGGYWTWTGFAPHIKWSLEATEAAVKSCNKYGIKDMFFTMWGDNGAECSKFSTLPAMYAGAQFAKGNFDMESVKKGFEEMFGVGFDEFSFIELPLTDNIVKCNNPDKYMLYNDCFSGVFDCKVRDGQPEKYRESAERLRKISKGNEYSYIFENIANLCEVLAVKYDLGVRTRKAYIEGKKDELAKLLSDYDGLVLKIERFYESFEKQWMLENKPFGFEVQDVRIGGLIMRIRHCAKRIGAYLNGETDRIEELEAPVLNFYGGNDTTANEAVEFNIWAKTFTVNNV